MLVDRLTRLIPDRGRHSPVEARHLLKLRSEHRCVVEQAVSLVHFYLVLSLHARANRAVNRSSSTLAEEHNTLGKITEEMSISRNETRVEHQTVQGSLVENHRVSSNLKREKKKADIVGMRMSLE